MMKLALTFLAVTFCVCFSKAQTPSQAISDNLQAILNNSLPSNFTAPGAVMGIYVPGQWSWYGSSGNAISGITAGQPLTQATPTTRFRIGSITKMMLATAVLKLEQDGLLSIEDPISTYLRPTLINDTIMSSSTVLIRHLLNHTSGIANSGDNNTCSADVLANPLGSHTLEEAIFCGTSLGESFPPGTSWEYSNTNYSILAMIIQNITGISCADYLNQTIYSPQNLMNTEIPSTNQLSGPHMGCYWNLGSWEDLTIINPTTYTGWADAVSSTFDLIHFYDSLLSGNIINTAQLDKMKLIDAAANDYGLGMDFYTISTIPYYGHYGEVGNTSGLFFSNTTSDIAPNGYYIAYNFNTQGVAMQSKIDVPVFQLLNSPLGISANNLPESINIYPLPATNKITIEHFPIESKTSMELIDLNGRIVMEIQPQFNSTKTEVELTSIQKGLYLFILKNVNEVYSKKVVIE